MGTEQQKVNPVVPTTPGEIPIPADYLALGAKVGYDPKPPEATRLYVTGLAGEGKSTFVSSIPNNLILDYEGGADGVVAGRTIRIRVRGYDHHLKIIEQLKTDAAANKRHFRRVTFDTHDGWVEMEQRHLMDEKSTATRTVEDVGEYGQKGHGHSLIQGRCKKLLGMLEDLGYAWAVVGHLTYVTETDPITYAESTKIRPILSKGYVGPVVRKAELHVTINSTTKKEKVNKVIKGKTLRGATEVPVTRYYLFTRPTEAKAMEGKRRGVPKLAGKMEVPMIGGWDILLNAYNDAVAASKKENGN